MAAARNRGFTLPELMIVITILAVLLAAGIPSMAEFVRNQRVKTASFDLLSTLVFARSEAITRNATVKVEPLTAGAWATGWTVKDAAGTVLRTLEPTPNVAIDGPTNVEFRGSGRLVTTTVPTFELTATGTNVTSRCIRVDLSGRPTTKASTC